MHGLVNLHDNTYYEIEYCRMPRLATELFAVRVFKVEKDHQQVVWYHVHARW